jgi:hypothetical protein
MNILLNDLKKFVKKYIDDIIYRSKTFREHLKHLRTLFRIFLRKEIIINSLKIFLEYQSVILLRQRVNVFELIIVEEKLKAIALLKFSENLIAFERYLDLVDYLRDKIYFFVDVFKSLQELKIKLLKNSSKKNRRKRFINKIKIVSINKKMTFFLLLQKDLIKTTLLMHFDKNKWLWIGLDEFKKFEFEMIVFHVTRKFHEKIWSTKNDIQIIMFWSRLLTIAERNYWSTELETANLIWIIKKVRHLIQSSKISIIIQTDHVIIIDICNQTSIINTYFVMKINLRLIRISQFLNQFSNLKIRHKSKKYHLIFDALFRLQSLNKENLSNDHAKLNELFVSHNVIYAYNTTLMKLNSEFRKKIIDDYFTNESWKKIIHTINQNEALDENAAKLFFVRKSATISRESDLYMTSSMKSSLKISMSNHSNNKNLIYHVNKSTKEKRLCIYAAEWFDLIWISTPENQIDVDLIPCRYDVISIRFDFEFYRFGFERIIYRIYIYIECFYI